MTDKKEEQQPETDGEKGFLGKAKEALEKMDDDCEKHRVTPDPTTGWMGAAVRNHRG